MYDLRLPAGWMERILGMGRVYNLKCFLEIGVFSVGRLEFLGFYQIELVRFFFFQNTCAQFLAVKLELSRV